MSVAQGIAQPRINEGCLNNQQPTTYRNAGPTTPPKVEKSGMAAFRGDDKEPPGRIDSRISLAAIPKNIHMSTSLTQNSRG